MKYFYFISTILIVSLLFIFSNLNPEIISLDLFFMKIEGVTIGFSIISSILIGAIISFFLQLPKLLRRNAKVSSDKKNENP